MGGPYPLLLLTKVEKKNTKIIQLDLNEVEMKVFLILFCEMLAKAAFFPNEGEKERQEKVNLKFYLIDY